MISDHRTDPNRGVKQLSIQESKSYFTKVHSSLKAHSLTLGELVEKINDGYCFVPSLFTGRVETKSFQHSRTIVLDIDKTEGWSTFERIKKCLEEELQLHINFYYETESSTEENPRFRIVLIFDGLITNSDTYKQIAVKLSQKVGGDENTMCTKLWQPCFKGHKVKVLCEELNSSQNPFILLCMRNVVNSKTARVYSKPMLRKFESDFVNKDGSRIGDTRPPIRNFSYDIVKSHSSVFRDFANGQLHLKYAQLRNLVTNMRHVSGGLQFVKESMDLMQDSYTPSDYALIEVHKKYDWKPEGIGTFDPSIEGLYTNILDIQQKRRGRMRVVEPMPVRQELPAAEAALEENMYTALTIPLDELTTIFLLQADPGIGKTSLIVKVLRRNQELPIGDRKKYVVAIPSHDLIDEFCQQLDKQAIDYLRIPDIRFEEIGVQKAIDACFSLNNFKQSTAIIEGVSKNDRKPLYMGVEGDQDDRPFLPNDIQHAQKYLEAKKEMKTTSRVVVMTHQRVLISQVPNNRPVLVDEDIWTRMLPITTVDLKTVVQELQKGLQYKSFSTSEMMNNYREDIHTYINFFSKLEPNQIKRCVGTLILNNFDLVIHGLSEMCENLLVVPLLCSTHVFLKQGKIYGIRKMDIQITNRKVILSGTADIWLYSRLYPGVRFMGGARVRNKGEVCQIYDMAYYKSQFRKGKFPPIKPNSNVISYKASDAFQYPDHWKILTDCYFFNAEGTNRYENQDLSVVGTPLLPFHVLILYYHALGFPPIDDISKTWRVIRLDNYEYYTYTYRNEDLAQLEQRLARQEIEQGAARSRSLRNDALVHVFSNIPARQTTLFFETLEDWM